MYTTQRIERRRYQRLGVNLSSLYKIKAPDYVRNLFEERNEFEGMITDLSEGGLTMTVGHSLPVATKLSISFVIYEYDHLGIVNFYIPLKVSGYVRNINSDLNDEYRMGISFCGINDDKQERLEDILYSSLRPSNDLV